MAALGLAAAFLIVSRPTALVAMVVGRALAFVAAFAVQQSYWFSYITWLVYVGALLVLFIYVCLVTRNRQESSGPAPLIGALVGCCLQLIRRDCLELRYSPMTGAIALSSGRASLLIALVFLLFFALLLVTDFVGSAGRALRAGD